VSSCSLVFALLDTFGYWGYPKDFWSALLLDRGSEAIGLGVKGLQLLDYLVGGVALACLAGGLSKRRVDRRVKEVTLTLECLKCLHVWEEPMPWISLQLMDYPRVKNLDRSRCPKCGKFVRPKIADVRSHFLNDVGVTDRTGKRVKDRKPERRVGNHMMPTKVYVLAGVLISSILMLYVSYDYYLGLIRVAPDFQISASPSSVALYSSKGSSNSTTVYLTSLNGFQANVSLKIVKGFGIIGDVSFDLESYNVSLRANGKAQIVLRLYVTSAVAPGKYFFDVIATGNDLTRTVRVSVDVPY